MATTVLGLKTFAASDPVDYNEVNDNYVKIDNGVKTAMQGRAAYNLLDNSDFMINQRGQTSYSGNGYSIDRWEAELAGGATFAISVSSDKVTISKTGGVCRFYQILPKSMEGKTVTYAIKTGDGIFFGTCTVSAASEYVRIGNHTAYLSVYQGSGKSIYSIFFNDSSEDTIEIYWAALYEGAYTADTLPAYQPKGYAAELAECQRYYREVYRVFGESVGNVAREAIILNPPMRIPPTATVKSLWKGTDDTSVTVNLTSNDNVDVTYTGFGNLRLSLSADL